MWTLYDPADPDTLGTHRYSRRPPPLFQRDETARGIIYTTRGGFIDLAHLRMTIDWTYYCTREVRRAVNAGDTAHAIQGTNNAVLHVAFVYPPDWDDLPDAERAALADELSLRIGQRLGHLVISWFDHRTVPVIDERPSAFTYDDISSHAIGVRVADRAVRRMRRERGVTFDRAVTDALNEELRELGAVEPRYTDAAARAVEGSWWADGKPLKRQLDEGLAAAGDGDDLASRTIHPWVVPNGSFAKRGGAPSMLPPPTPVAFVLPSLADVNGRDFTGFYTVAIDPRIEKAAVMRSRLAGRPKRLSAEHDVPQLLRVVRAQMAEQFAPDFDRPAPPMREPTLAADRSDPPPPPSDVPASGF
jgi:hypothetical protein